MRKSYSTQLRLDRPPIDKVELNFGCRDAIVPVLRSLQRVSSKPDVTETIMQLIGRDIDGKSSAKRGREGMDYWHIKATMITQRARELCVTLVPCQS